jgi:hypothetical protein
MNNTQGCGINLGLDQLVNNITTNVENQDTINIVNMNLDGVCASSYCVGCKHLSITKDSEDPCKYALYCDYHTKKFDKSFNGFGCTAFGSVENLHTLRYPFTKSGLRYFVQTYNYHLEPTVLQILKFNDDINACKRRGCLTARFVVERMVDLIKHPGSYTSFIEQNLDKHTRVMASGYAYLIGLGIMTNHMWWDDDVRSICSDVMDDFNITGEDCDIPDLKKVVYEAISLLIDHDPDSLNFSVSWEAAVTALRMEELWWYSSTARSYANLNGINLKVYRFKKKTKRAFKKCFRVLKTMGFK